MSLTAKKITILGAGIGGVAAALAMARRGAEVEVLEQAPKLAEVGAGLQIGPNGMQVLHDLGLSAAMRARATQPQSVELRDYRRGRLVTRVTMGQRAEKRYGQPHMQVHRADLLDILVTAAREAGVGFRLGVEATALTYGAGGVALEIKDGAEHHADLLIGADGVRSRTRTQVVGGTAPDFTGQVAWRGLVDGSLVPDGLLADCATVFLGPGRHLVTYPLRDRTFWNVVAVETRAEWASESWSTPTEAAEVRAAFKGWCAPVETLLAGLEECFLWGLFDHKVLERWSDGPVVLLGDACHPMLPFLAQGATMAIEDAWVLAAMLDQHDDPSMAFAAYEAARKPRVARVQKMAMTNAQLYHLSTPGLRLGAHLGLAIASTLTPGLMMGAFDWLYGHDVTAG